MHSSNTLHLFTHSFTPSLDNYNMHIYSIHYTCSLTHSHLWIILTCIHPKISHTLHLFTHSFTPSLDNSDMHPSQNFPYTVHLFTHSFTPSLDNFNMDPSSISMVYLSTHIFTPSLDTFFTFGFIDTSVRTRSKTILCHPPDCIAP